MPRPPRPQFTLKTMLWLMVVVAVGLMGFVQGRRYERSQFRAESERLAAESDRIDEAEAWLVDRYQDLVRRQLKEEVANAPDQSRRSAGGSYGWFLNRPKDWPTIDVGDGQP